MTYSSGLLALVILKTAENYTYLTFAHPVLKPLPASGRGLELSPY